MLLMQDYSGPEYDNLYEEILLDYHYRFPKYSPIPYPQLRNDSHEKKNNCSTIRKGH
jgi:hypothetical protein